MNPDQFAQQHGFRDAATMMGFYRTKQGIMQGQGAHAPQTWGGAQPVQTPGISPNAPQGQSHGALADWLNGIFGKITGAMNGNR